MAINIAATISATGWGDRRQSLFIDGIVKSAKFLNRLTIVDGVKSKALIPTYDASLTYGNNICDLTDGTGGQLDLGEKEVANKPYTWYFNNCKKTLETTYRSLMLRKGQLNEQTLDDDLKDWVMTHFAKLNAAKCMQVAADEIVTELKADADVVKVTTAKTAAIDILNDMYKAIPQELLDTMYGETDKEFAPVIMANANFIRDYSMEVAAKDVISYNGVAEGKIPPYMGMEVVCFSTLPDGCVIIGQPNNFLLVTDDYGDTQAIQNDYNPKKNLDEWFGQFRLGFSYRYSKFVIFRDAPAARMAK